MDLFFRMLPPGDRKDLDIAICAALVQNGLPRHQTVYNERKIQLHTMSLSSVFSILLVSQPIGMGFNLPKHGVIRDIQNLVSQLKSFIAMTYWLPSVATDDREAFDLMRMDEGREYYRFLQGLAERYVTDVDKFCADHPDLCAMLDKPNLHRLLELYQHFIPAFGHVSLFQELVFETAHKPLKRSVARENHRHEEVSAVEQCLGNYWQARIGMLYERLRTGEAKERVAAFNGLRQLIIGRDAETSYRDDNRKEKQDELNEAIEHCFSAPLILAIRSNGSVNHALIGGSIRCVTESEGGAPQLDNHNSSYASLMEVMEAGRRMLFNRTGMFGKKMEEICIRWRAKRKIPASTVGESLISSQDILEPGTLIQAMVGASDKGPVVLRPQTNGEAVLRIFMIIGFLDNDEDEPWLIGVGCTRTGRNMIVIPSERDYERVELIVMNEGPRRIAVYHACKYGDTC